MADELRRASAAAQLPKSKIWESVEDHIETLTIAKAEYAAAQNVVIDFNAILDTLTVEQKDALNTSDFVIAARVFNTLIIAGKEGLVTGNRNDLAAINGAAVLDDTLTAGEKEDFLTAKTNEV